VGWFAAESWGGEVRPLAVWYGVESWTGSVHAPIEVGWFGVESWSGSIVVFEVEWVVLESWTAVIRAPVLPPVLTSPDDGAHINDNTPLLEWESYRFVDNFPLQLDNDSDFSSPLFEEVLFTTWYSCPEELPDGVYYWRMKSFWGGESSVWGSPRAFRVDTVPPVPPAPFRLPDGENTNDNTPTLEWSRVTDISLPVSYRLTISDEPDFSGENFSSGWIEDNDWTAPMLPEGAWYWRVCARDGAGNIGENSETRRFRVDMTKPGTPTLLSPEDWIWINDSSPTLTWTAVSDVSGPVIYELQIDDRPIFRWLEAEATGLTNNFYTVPYLYDEDEWYWRVRAIDGAGNPGDYENGVFRLDTEPPRRTPLLRSPSNNLLTNDPTPSFDWSSVSDPCGVTYTLEIVGALTKEKLLASDYTLGSDEALASGTYTWRVRAVDNAGNEGAWSKNFTLTVDLTSPILEVLEPTKRLVSENLEILVKATDPSGVDAGSISVKLDNQPVTHSWVDNKVFVELEELAEGFHEIEIGLRDRAANESSLSIEFKVVVENIKIEMLAPTWVVMVEENWVEVVLKFMNMTDNSISRAFEIRLGERGENLVVEIPAEGENIITAEMDIRGLSPENYPVLAIDRTAGKTIDLGAIQLGVTEEISPELPAPPVLPTQPPALPARPAPPALPAPPVQPTPLLWPLFLLTSISIGVGSGLLVWYMRRSRMEKKPEVLESEVAPIFVERETPLPVSEGPFFSLPGETPSPQEYRAYLLGAGTVPFLEREWSKFVDRHREEVSPLMAEYRELLKPEKEAMALGAPPEESFLMVEYRALVGAAARESENEGNPGHSKTSRNGRRTRANRVLKRKNERVY
jgi:hypothetical protein